MNLVINLSPKRNTTQTMKKILFFVVITILSLSSFSQTQIYLRSGENISAQPDINFFGYGKKLNKSGTLKMSYFALVEKSWAEGLIGLSYSPTSWCELGIMGGIETNPNIYRGSASICLTGKKFSFSTCIERGGGNDNWWYKTTALYSASKKLTVGLMSWRFNATGPYAEYSVSKAISIWSNPGYDLEAKEKRFIIGLNIKM